MVAMAQQDAPWAFGYFPWGGLAFQQWVYNGKPSILIRDMAKYYRVDPPLRVAKQARVEPAGLVAGGAARWRWLLALVWVARRGYQRAPAGDGAAPARCAAAGAPNGLTCPC